MGRGWPAALGLAAGLTIGVIACGGGARKEQPGQATGTAGEASSPAVSNAAPLDNGPIMIGDHSIIRSEALGPLHVGEWRRPVMSFVYAISARAGRDSTDIIVVHGIGKDTATLSFQNDTLRRIFVLRPGPHTANGIGIGTPFATVAASAGAHTATRGTAQVATLSNMCGVEFATDSAALSTDSIVRGPARSPSTIRAIAIGYCKR